VYYQFRPNRLKDPVDTARIGNIHSANVNRFNLVIFCLELAHKLAAEATVSAGDKDTHI
jgi:hypothetical protein